MTDSFARLVRPIAVATLVLTCGPARAQGPHDARDVQAAVEHFLDLAGRRDTDRLLPLLAPQATINVARFRDGRWTHTSQTLEAWVAGLRAQATAAPFREPLTDITIQVEDGQLAHLRARFTILVDGAVQSHGVDYVTLVRLDGAWKVANLSYTNLPGAPK